jgi:8-oxo-dGTP diphosphatase
MAYEPLKPELQVAAGVVKNTAGQVLISRRGHQLHQGGLWEFPGGKVEPGETVEQALVRELEEELDIHALSYSPLITLSHRYPDLTVRLHVFMVDDFSGEPDSRIGQPIRWVMPDALPGFDFPEANLPITRAVRLPVSYAILDDAEPTQLMTNLQTMLARGVVLVQARLKNLSPQACQAFMREASILCRQNSVRLLWNSANAVQVEGVAGIHLTSSDLMRCRQRPPNTDWVAASCHNLDELQQAEKIGADFAVLAPVLPTLSHPGTPTLGWAAFTRLTAQVNLPVYALGGLSMHDLAMARQAGAQGIAGIRMFLS